MVFWGVILIVCEARLEKRIIQTLDVAENGKEKFLVCLLERKAFSRSGFVLAF